MYLKCPIHHVLLKVNDALIEQAKAKHLLGIKRFNIKAKPLGGNHRYVVMLDIPPITIHAMYILNDTWSIRTSP